MTDLPNKSLLRPDEVAKYLSVSVKTVYRWIDMGRIEGVKVAGGLVRIPREAIDKAIEPAAQ